MGPELGKNLRPFARRDLSGSDKGKSDGMVTTKLSSLARFIFSCVIGPFSNVLHCRKSISIEEAWEKYITTTIIIIF